MKVHQLFVNEDGWLVAAPYLTNGETLDEKGLDRSDIIGDYEVIIHRLNINYGEYEVNGVEHISLNEDGSVTGDYEGSWEAVDGTAYLRLTTSEDTYSGVALKMKIEGSSIDTTVFTCLGQKTQVTFWGSRQYE